MIHLHNFYSDSNYQNYQHDTYCYYSHEFILKFKILFLFEGVISLQLYYENYSLVNNSATRFQFNFLYSISLRLRI